MNKLDYYLNEVIGKKTNRDIYCANEKILIPLSTVITYDHIILLEDSGITLTVDDVIDISTNVDNHAEMIDETVAQVRNIFGYIRRTQKIPLNSVRENVIPMILEASDSKHLLQLFASLQAKDDYTYRHNIAVGVISNLIGKWMNIDHKALLQLTTAALLHDVGKMLVPETILNKPGMLTTEEFEIMKKHTIYGYKILKETIGITQRQQLVALQHHERMDGSGYPAGISGKDIDLFSRIVSVADVFHAMSSNRVYQNNSPFYIVLSVMENEMFSALDPAITLLFIEKTMGSLIGNTVLLTDGQTGTIIMIPRNNLTRPLIQVDDNFINLSEKPSLQIEQIIH